MNDSKPSISLFFPVYNDEGTVRTVTEKAIEVLKRIASRYQIIIINDGSPDRSGEVADQLAKEIPEVSVVHHPRCKGYGSSLQDGLKLSLEYDWICFTDGDDQYDVRELYHIAKLFPRYDAILTFRYCKIYSTWRMFMSYVYNVLVRFLFRSHFRDISCGLKAVRSEVIKDLTITSNSPFIGGEIAIKSMLRGYAVGEVGISTYPRTFGISTSTSMPNVAGTLRDMWFVYREVFSNKPRTRV